MQYVSLEHILSMASENLGYSDTAAHTRFTEWAYDAECSIGPTWNHVRNKLLPIVDNRAEKPCGYLVGEELALVRLEGDVTGEVINSADAIQVQVCDAVYPIYRGKTMFCLDSVNSVNRIQGRPMATGVNHGGHTFSQDDEYFYFSNLEGSGLNYVSVSYLGTPVDDNGNIRIPEPHGRAVVAYIEYMEKKRIRNLFPRRVSMGDVQFAYQQWAALKADAYGRERLPDAHQMREIAAKAVSMIKKVSRSREYSYRANNKF